MFLGIVSQERVREFLLLLLDSKVDEALDFVRDLSQRGGELIKERSKTAQFIVVTLREVLAS